MILLANILIDSLAYGMVLFMIAVGLSITLGLMRFVNLAHGVFAIAGGYGVVWFLGHFGMRYEYAVLASIVAVILASLLLERWLFSRLYGSSELDQVLFTIGVVFISIAGAGLLFGNSVTPVPLPEYLRGSFDLGFRLVQTHRVFVVIAGALVLMALHWLLNRTRFGVETRAAVDNPKAAEAMGIRTARVYALAFALGAALAALGGILGAELLPVEPYYPLKYMVLLLAIVAVGGVGNPFGLLGSALTLGTVETGARYLVPELASILFYITMLAVLAWRPAGIFSRRA